MADPSGERPQKMPKYTDNESYQSMATPGERSDGKLKSVGDSDHESNTELREEIRHRSKNVQESEGFDVDSLGGHDDGSDPTMTTSDEESDREPVHLDDSDSDEEDTEEYRNYAKQVRESEGFDLDTDYGCNVLGGMVRLDLNGDDPFDIEGMDQAKDCTAYAIAENNRKQDAAKLELDQILTVNTSLCAGPMYFITLKARNASTGERNIYQTKVFVSIENQMEVEIFREKPQRQDAN